MSRSFWQNQMPASHLQMWPLAVPAAAVLRVLYTGNSAVGVTVKVASDQLNGHNDQTKQAKSTDSALVLRQPDPPVAAPQCSLHKPAPSVAYARLRNSMTSATGWLSQRAHLLVWPLVAQSARSPAGVATRGSVSALTCWCGHSLHLLLLLHVQSLPHTTRLKCKRSLAVLAPSAPVS
jgi:hypothetical protein